MASLKQLKMRIASVKSTQKITKAMKMVAAAKLRRASEAAEAQDRGDRPGPSRLGHRRSTSRAQISSIAAVTSFEGRV